ncbi:hypothetical protein [Kitasatospora aureofaciens]|uniref:hypothetical protein n=1 Tax=Kitasatospora aureofaciens TaxID=1894 RepID=UPI0037CAB6A8
MTTCVRERTDADVRADLHDRAALRAIDELHARDVVDAAALCLALAVAAGVLPGRLALTGPAESR